jgi:glycosyltransferase involved in cell wall biosynthesis
VISSYDELCGIAAYTRALERQLKPFMDVEVFDLDQFLLRHPSRRVQRLGDRHIQEIASRLGEFDFVNIQLEYGTLGLTSRKILRRAQVLMAAAPALTVTFHTMLATDGVPWSALAEAVRRLRPLRAAALLADSMRGDGLGRQFHALLRRMQRRKPVRVIAHTRRDARLLRDLHGITQVAHHPLAFIRPAEAATIRANAQRDAFPLLRGLPREAKLIGTFGFLSPYKGFETAIRALQLLPEDHQLLVFGGVHPNAIARHQPIDPYVERLLQAGRIGQSVLDGLREPGSAPAALTLDAGAGTLLGGHPQDLRRRIHFMGVLDDGEFCTAMAICDSVVLPYVEVGQTSSGPISMALDMGCRVIASRNRAFLQMARYHPGEIEFFDIGNYAELAARIAADPPFDRRGRVLAYNTDTNAALYLRLHKLDAKAASPARQAALP